MAWWLAKGRVGLKHHPGIVYIPIEPTAMIGLTCYWRKADPNPILKLFIDIVRKYKI